MSCHISKEETIAQCDQFDLFFFFFIYLPNIFFYLFTKYFIVNKQSFIDEISRDIYYKNAMVVVVGGGVV